MDFNLLILVLLISSFYLQYGDSQTLSIRDFLSDSNNTNADQTQAFQAAWKALCGGKATSLVIHANEIYTTQPQLFQGPCVARHPHIRIDGKVEAPKTVGAWGSKKSEYWLCFDQVTGLVLDGTGLLDPHGESWWSSVAFSSRPEALRFSGCKDITYNGLTQINSPRNHVSLYNCINATLSNLHITAPENSPNTDGIDISLSRNIHIDYSAIKTGDDCIAIKGGSYDINITRVACGPGHGISIGSLGEGGATETVENVNVRHCEFTGTQNGARIKTRPGGGGFAKNIMFEDIVLTNAKGPIIIDQQYNDNDRANGKAVKVSQVTFKNFRGTCAEDVAIKLDCDRNIGCDNIVLEHINITSSTPRRPLSAYCQFARVISRFVSIGIKCGHNSLGSPGPFPQLPAPHGQPPAPFPQPPAPHAQPPAPLAQPPAPHAQPPPFFSFQYFNY